MINKQAFIEAEAIIILKSFLIDSRVFARPRIISIYSVLSCISSKSKQEYADKIAS